MKKLFSLAMLLMVAVSSYAQKDVTKFLGIPVDGTKEDMIQKLLEKGFTRNEYDRDVLEGEFNGYDVLIFVVTNNNKVYRILVSDKNSVSESSIRIRFNNLCYQFEHNDNYFAFKEDDQTIPDDEDISYNMLLKNKRYQASFYQSPNMTIIEEDLLNMTAPVYNKYPAEDWLNPTEEMNQEMMKYIAKNILSKKSVWFTIMRERTQYRIVMYYDNEYNMANGEDL